MKSYLLDVKQDGQSGELGFVLRGIPFNTDLFMASTDGVLLAHDIMEHVNGLESIGTVEDECQALGGIWWVRGQYGDLRRDNIGSALSVEYNIGADISRMYEELNSAGETIKEPTEPPRRLIKQLEDMEYSFRKIIEEAEKGVRSEWSSYHDDDVIDEAHLKHYLDTTYHWMCIGIRKATRRHRKAWEANQKFWDIANAFKPYRLTSELFEGQVFRLLQGHTEWHVEEVYDRY